MKQPKKVLLAEEEHAYLIFMISYFWFFIAAIAEIAGCFTFWMWLRESRSGFWIIPGLLSLAIFAVALTRVDSSVAGRSYAAYGGVYILASLLWMIIVEKQKPDLWDFCGVALCIAGSMLIVLPSRT